jgi:hypothetical protein
MSRPVPGPDRPTQHLGNSRITKNLTSRCGCGSQPVALEMFNKKCQSCDASFCIRIPPFPRGAGEREQSEISRTKLNLDERTWPLERGGGISLLASSVGESAFYYHFYIASLEFIRQKSSFLPSGECLRPEGARAPVRGIPRTHGLPSSELQGVAHDGPSGSLAKKQNHFNPGDPMNKGRDGLGRLIATAIPCFLC